MKKILVVTLSNLGDVVLTLPVFQALRQAYPDARLDVIVGAGSAPVFEGDRRIGHVIAYDKRASWPRKLALLRRIRQERYDLIIDLRHSLFGLFGGAKRRNPYVFFSRKKHRAFAHFQAVRPFVGDTFPKTSFLRVGGPSSAESGSGQKLVVVCPGSKSDTKKWPVESYARLLDRLVEEKGCRVVLAGDKKDKQDAEKIKLLMKNEVEDVAGRTDFRELCAWIGRASVVVTNDSAPLHIADALKIPCLAIFGPTDPVKYGPRLPQSLVARRVLFCSPCEKAQCRYRHECMTELSVNEVYSKARRILDDDGRTQNPKILFIRLDRIGDVVLSLPAIAAVRRHFPNAHIAVMTRPYTQEALEGHPDIDEIIPYRYEKKGRHRVPFGYLRFLGEIVSRRFDVAFVLHPSWRSHLIPFLVGIPYRIGLASHASFLLSKAVKDSRHEGLKHESEYALDIVRAFGIDSAGKDAREIEFPFFFEHMAKVRALLEQSGCVPGESLIAFHAGASCPSKRWPLERFAELARRILAELPHRIVIVGGKGEAPLAEALAEKIGDRVSNLTGHLSIKETAALLHECELLVSNDSGPVHIAAAVGIPTLTIFGRKQPGLGSRRWKALGKGHITVQRDVGCVVCLAHRCPIEFECLTAIGAGEVFERLKAMIHEYSQKTA